jgi:TatD DNase family protein
MTDAHFHRNVYDCHLSLEGHETRFFGIHPWQADAMRTEEAEAAAAEVEAALARDVRAGVGEIGLDRLRAKAVSPAQRTVFGRQLAFAAAFSRPAVIHGAKCWGEVVKACEPYVGSIPAFLFHGFSRSEGLLPQIFAMNGFVSVGPSLLNDHAVNYRAMAKSIPLERLLVETDMDETDTVSGDGAASSRAGTLRQVLLALAALRGVGAEELEHALDANARRFTEALS